MLASLGNNCNKTRSVLKVVNKTPETGPVRNRVDPTHGYSVTQHVGQQLMITSAVIAITKEAQQYTSDEPLDIEYAKKM
ncbi:hypothetical protein BPOR_2208g00010 [Botrytis porri]|uniref:Uncharacterized protein n=1 Tax=Botrytis porri TaxID=87229 RepID=A0A4Z1JX31_9HELO|nr:hypothetical protein BPOR_2208g00010 [Botrytis porri]